MYDKIRKLLPILSKTASSGYISELKKAVPGDLLVLIEEEKHPELIRDESDLIYKIGRAHV